MSDTAVAAPPNSRLQRALAFIERAGNALPHPATIFVLFALAVVLGSELAYRSGISVAHPVTGEITRPISLFNIAGLHRMLTEMVRNFTGFAPLGTVLVAMLGIAVAEGSGLISTALRLLVLSAPRRLLTVVVVFAGVMSNTAGEVGYVLLVPLSASLFLAAGRHPIVGLVAAFAGVSGGYSANLLLGTIDPLLSGLTQEAAHILDPAYTVSPTANYYFMFVSVFIVTAAGTLITERVVAPRFGRYTGPEGGELPPGVTRAERRGLIFAAVAAALFTALLLAGTVPANGFLRDPNTGDLLHSPFMSGIVALIFFGGLIVGAAYGLGAGTIRSDSDIVRGMSKQLDTMGSYLVLVFFAAQFVAYFNWTKLGLVIAVKGSEFLRTLDLGGIPLVLAFIVVAAFTDLLIGSASAKWAIMAPVFVPMLMLLGISPELTQAAYRIGDSIANIISPMMTYFALIVSFVQRYDRNAGIGTLLAAMLPYSVGFLIVWSLLLAVWMLAGWPLGPGAPLYVK